MSSCESSSDPLNSGGPGCSKTPKRLPHLDLAYLTAYFHPHQDLNNWLSDRFTQSEQDYLYFSNTTSSLLKSEHSTGVEQQTYVGKLVQGKEIVLPTLKQTIADPHLHATVYGKSLVNKNGVWHSHPQNITNYSSQILKPQLSEQDKAFYLHQILTGLTRKYKRASTSQLEVADLFVRCGGDIDAVEYLLQQKAANNTRGR